MFQKVLNKLEKLKKNFSLPGIDWYEDDDWDGEGKMYLIQNIIDSDMSQEFERFVGRIVNCVLEEEDGTFVLHWFDDYEEELKNKTFDSFKLLCDELEERHRVAMLFYTALDLTIKYSK